MKILSKTMSSIKSVVQETGTNGTNRSRMGKRNASSERVTASKSTAPTLKGNLKLLVMLLMYILFNLFGGFLFKLIEKKENEGQPHHLPDLKKQFVANHSTCLTYEDLEKFISELEYFAENDGIKISGNDTTYPEVWTLNNGFILAFTIASTIGYGLVTPITTGGQLFSIFFAFLSIPFTGLLAAKIGWVMAYYIKKGSTRIMGLVPKAKAASLFFTLLFGLLVYMMLPSILLTFVSNEEGWSFVNSFYCVIITLTTIGFGDYVPDPSTQGGIVVSIFVLVWVIAGLAWFATIVQLIATHMSRQAKTLRRKVTSPPLIRHFNHNNKTKGKNEICETMTGQDNGAIIVNKVPDSSKCMSNGDGSVTEDELTEDDCSTDQLQTCENILGPGSFHAVVMVNMPKDEDRT